MATGLMVAILLTGCGGGGSGEKKAGKSPAATTPVERTGGAGVGRNACGLVTKPEVEAALGASVQAPSGAGDSGVCSFMTTGGQVLLLSTASPDNVKQFDSLKRNVDGPVETLSGLGDRAFLVKGQAYVLKGSTLVAITVLLSQPAPKLNQVARQLAQTAAGRI